ncbi:hypothetical protein AQUCO_01000089v1 [Aquilegia coerulea]|uniref:J domain-containing protein n=1 Tax=Aquilegia coerulea TaxID=218851 RepID=A0A2G5E890_AQUCA|nr:hypothetical protein AQUCO_01000089v1 [Aquilegia coerulea]
MRGFNWLGFASRSLLRTPQHQQWPISSTISELVYNHGVKHISIFSQALHSCCCPSFDRVSYETSTSSANLYLMKRHFHSTGVCYAMEKDMYKVLGVSKNASQDEIKKAYLTMAKKYHPDANNNNPASKKKFQEIREAYETLRDSEKRAQYDEGRTRGAARREYATREEYDFGDSYRVEVQFSDSFHKIFSEVFEHETEQVAADIQVDLALSFSEAAQGCTKHLSFDARVPCDSCNGLGHPIGAKLKVCPSCEGFGTVTVPPFTSTCSTCKGSGRIIKCKPCRGFGVVDGVKEVNVSIPAGVESGDVIRVPQGGNSGGRGVQSGNLYIKLKVAMDPVFQRVGADIYVDSYISFTQAILGGSVDVPTLSGKMQVKIPKGVQPGELLILRGRGLPKQGGFYVTHGDLYVRFRIKFPTATSLNERQHALLEELAKEEMSVENSASGESWWQQIVDRLTNPSFVYEISFILLILFILGKSM